MKQEADMTNLDYSNWLQGMYIYEAICDASPILQAFAKKGTKPLPYSDKPYSVKKKEEEKKQITKQEQENERLKAIVYFNNWARATSKHFENKT